MRDTPAISSSTYASSAVNMAAFGMGVSDNTAWVGSGDFVGGNITDNGYIGRRVAQFNLHTPSTVIKETDPMAAPTRRLVQVFIADPNENVPLADSLLYSGEQKLTDATDQELFFEIDIKSILEKHNAKRVKMVDKKVKERTEYLEPAKIRDLKMVVVNVAGF